VADSEDLVGLLVHRHDRGFVDQHALATDIDERVRRT
jgi:hypothetical protein